MNTHSYIARVNSDTVNLNSDIVNTDSDTPVGGGWGGGVDGVDLSM